MYGRQLFQITVVMIVLLIMAGCAGTSAPNGWLPKSTESQSKVNGAWANVDILQGKEQMTTEGELIAVHDDSLFILTGGGLEGINQKEIKKVKLTSYQPEGGQIAGWTLGGILMTASHGWLLVFSAPTWLITGIVASSSASREPMVYYNNPNYNTYGRKKDSTLNQFDSSNNWKNLAKWARFPQGLPPELNRVSLGVLSGGESQASRKQ